MRAPYARGSRATGTLFVPFFLAGVLAIVPTACGDGTRAGSPGDEAGADTAVLVRDSAGIRIVENPEHAPDSTGWWIDTVPSLVIGDDETRGEEYLFGSVSDARRLPDGRLVVADGQTGDVRLFDASGRFIRRIGRQGDGPGEYRAPWRLFLLGEDTIAVRSVYDGAPAPFFTWGGEFLRQWRSPEGQASVFEGPYGLFEDGTLLVHVRNSREVAWNLTDPRTPVVIESSARLLRVDAEGSILSDYGEWITGRTVHYYYLRPLPFGGAASEPTYPQGFVDGTSERYLSQPLTEARGMDLYRAQGDPFDVLVFDEEARLRRIVRKRHTRVPIPRTWADSMWTWMVDLYTESEVADGIVGAEPPPVPEHAPAIDRLLFDDLGNLWVRSSPVGHPEPPTWFVFDETGVLAHSLTTELDPVQIGDDFVLAVPRDELGVSRVALFPLYKEHRR